MSSPILLITIFCFLIGCCHSYQLECTSHHMSITYEIGVDEKVTAQSEIKFENTNCFATRRNVTHWIIVAGFQNCSTSMRSTEHFISFINTVVIDPKTNTPGTVIERDHHTEIKYRFTCNLNRDTNIRIGESFEIG